jgi:hypothetical protein
MKLRHRPEPRTRIRSAEALVREDQPESDFFDPRIDFPQAELVRIKNMAVHLGGDLDEQMFQLFATLDLKKAWWLALIDPEFKAVLDSHSEFASGLKADFDHVYQRKAGNPKGNPESVLAAAVPAIQLFPALRQQIRQGYSDAQLPQLLQKETRSQSLLEKLQYISTMLQLYPEKRAEWLEIYSLNEAEVVGSLRENFLDPVGVRLFLEIKAEMLANALLVFPTLRSQIMSLDLPREAWKKQFKSQNPISLPDFDYAFALTVIGAEDARINDDGQIELKLKPLPMKKEARPLPDRPGV